MNKTIACIVVLLAAAGMGNALAQSPLSVSAQTLVAEASQGGVGEVSCAVVNTTTDSTVNAWIEGRVTYADGKTDRLIGPTVLPLGPGFGFEIAPLFLVPADTALGPATFTCSAHATKISGDDRRSDFDNPTKVSAQSSFVVVP